MVALVALAGAVLLTGARVRSSAAQRRLLTLHQRWSGRRGNDGDKNGSTTGKADPDRFLPAVAAAGALVAATVLLGARGLVVAGGLSPGLYFWVRHLTARRPAMSDARDRLPLVFDLLAAALRAGVPVAVAVGCAAVDAPLEVRRELNRSAALLMLGAQADEAWRSARSDPLLAPMAAVAIRSAASGIKLAEGLDRQAAALRAELRSAAFIRAQRVGVLALLPLGLCFLPAFVGLGVVPIVVGVASDAFGQIAS